MPSFLFITYIRFKKLKNNSYKLLEPDIIADIPIPIPKDRSIIDRIGNTVISSIEKLEQSIASSNDAKLLLNNFLS